MFSKQTYTYKVEGCELQADVYRLPDNATRPAMLWLHAGALIIGDRRWLPPEQLERYLQAGYAVIPADYRLAPEVKIESIIEDLKDAYHWVQMQGPDLFRIDPERIAVVGHSAGAYLTLMAGFCVDPRPTVLVSFYGYGDIAGAWLGRPDPHYSQLPAVPKEEAYGAVGGPVLTGTQFPEETTEKRLRFYHYCRQQGRWQTEVTGHSADEEPEWFKPFCPVQNITPEYPPTLLIHGQEDTDVPCEKSVLMSQELERQGVEHQLITLPGRGHMFDRQGMRAPGVSEVFDQVLAFLEKQGMMS